MLYNDDEQPDMASKVMQVSPTMSAGTDSTSGSGDSERNTEINAGEHVSVERRPSRRRIYHQPTPSADNKATLADGSSLTRQGRISSRPRQSVSRTTPLLRSADRQTSSTRRPSETANLKSSELDNNSGGQENLVKTEASKGGAKQESFSGSRPSRENPSNRQKSPAIASANRPLTRRQKLSAVMPMGLFATGIKTRRVNIRRLLS